MEERFKTAMISNPYKIVITGPESTGKTTLAEQLAAHYKGDFAPEYARTYVENLQRPYVFDDVEIIAKKQLADYLAYEKSGNRFVFFDTYLIITKVWFDVVFKQCPKWITEHLQNCKVDLFLVCNTDIPWVPDPVRENGGEMREELFQLYINELNNFNLKYFIIKGEGDERLSSAIKTIDRILVTH